MLDSMLHNPTFWVAVAFVLFFALGYKKIAKLLLSALDERSVRITAELDRARTLREEAEAVLAQYQQKQAEYLKEAETILAAAVKDAEDLRAFSERELKSALDVRMKQALDRIAQEESNAIADVRNHVVDIALAAARAIITEQANSAKQDELVKLAVSEIERKIH